MVAHRTFNPYRLGSTPSESTKLTSVSSMVERSLDKRVTLDRYQY
jgi:hypothetical protein